MVLADRGEGRGGVQAARTTPRCAAMAPLRQGERTRGGGPPTGLRRSTGAQARRAETMQRAPGARPSPRRGPRQQVSVVVLAGLLALGGCAAPAAAPAGGPAPAGAAPGGVAAAPAPGASAPAAPASAPAAA